MKLNHIFAFLLAVFALSACREVVITPQPIEPLYKTLAEYDSFSEARRDSVIHSDSVEIDFMFRFLGKNPSGNMDSLLLKWAKSPVMASYTPVVNTVFPDLNDLEDNLGLILENAKTEGLDFPKLKYVAVVWGSLKSIVTADSIMFIALNHFLGKDFPGYSDWEHYLREFKTPEQLPFALAESLVLYKYPYVRTETSTALSRMMYEGVMTYVKLKIVPNATLSNTLGYSTEQLEWLDSHYQEMWETLIGKNMIYSTSEFDAKRLVDPAPTTSVISPEYPGRVGRYLGYRLIINYVENRSDTPLTYLLSPNFYNNPSELVLAQ